MRLNVLPNTMIFEGILDEETQVADLMAGFEKLKTSGLLSPATLDLSNVSRANSSGILSWLRFLKEAKFQFKYVNAPVWLVGQFNMVHGFFDNGSYVESFQAPFYGEKSRASKNFNLRVGKDVPLLKDYTSYSHPNRIEGGEEFDVDFHPVRYFHFLTQNHESFKKIAAIGE